MGCAHGRVGADVSENRAPAQYCPYCGETNLWPHEESHGAWSCRDCRRVFAVRFVGLAGAGRPADPDVADADLDSAGAAAQVTS